MTVGSDATDIAVSVIMPVLNEGRHLRAAVRRVLGQQWPGRLEVILSVGPSRDDTSEIASALAEEDPRVIVVANPSGRTPDALNRAVAAATGEVIVRVDGHAEIADDYIATAVATLLETGADNVGGMMDARGVTIFERAVAVAMKSPVGVGNSRFHVGGESGPTETVYLGVFRTETIRRIGGYDTRYTRAQDWEMNHRIRQAGGLVYFTPALRVVYRPRSTVSSLARQYYDYGRWRRVVARRHRGTINARYLAAPSMVLGVAGAALLGAWRPEALAVPCAYLAGTVLAGLHISRAEPPQVRALTPLVLMTMHWSWGLGFLLSTRDLSGATDDVAAADGGVVGEVDRRA
nr:glycosyltransferase family 2 protein [Tetrasphaera sp. F2B08]